MDTSPQLEQQLRQACAQLDDRLRAGERCHAETFFSAFPLLGCHEDLAIELIYTEFVVREELQQRPRPEEFFARFPHWKARLERQFQVHDLMRDSIAAEDDLDVPPVEAEPLKRLGSSEILEEVARGSCGIVYRAWQPTLERVVAVKALRSEWARSLRRRQRFCQEARVMASLRHRHIMPIHDIGEDHGTLWFSMAFAESGSLATRLADGVTDEGELRAVLGIIAAAARAVHYAHRQGVIHCDLKPSNILLDADGEPLVSDFGLARVKSAEEDERFAGTPAYMAPEQFEAGPVGPAADVWALGVILYEALTGARPFDGRTLPELQENITQTVTPAPRESKPGIDPRLEAICMKCLARIPSDRFATAEELADAIRQTQSPSR